MRLRRLSRRGILLGTGAAICCSRREPLPELGTVPDFTLTDQDGRRVTRKTLAGRLWVAAFVFTRCPTVCPRITARMRELQKLAKERGVQLDLVSFSVDPEHDTPAVLKEYAGRFHAELDTWSFVTGDFEVVSRTAVEGFKLALEGRADAGAKDFGILHGSHLVLVDAAGTIRGFYRTDEGAEIRRLLDDAQWLAR